MQLSSPIAIGFTAEIYTWKTGQVLKLFNPGITRDTVEYEAKLTRLVHGKGVPVPEVGEIVEIEGRYGLEYEQIEGISMLKAFMRKPSTLPIRARQLAELQAGLHRVSLPEMPSLRERLQRKIRRAPKLPENVRQAALESLAILPEEDWLCHGDFHPGNILLATRGAVIIDWIDASRGNPILDVARSTLLIKGGPLPPGTPCRMKIIRDWFYRIYLRHYAGLIPCDLKQLKKWTPVVAAARLDENIKADEKRLLSIAQKLVVE